MQAKDNGWWVRVRVKVRVRVSRVRVRVSVQVPIVAYTQRSVDGMYGTQSNVLNLDVRAAKWGRREEGGGRERGGARTRISHK